MTGKDGFGKINIFYTFCSDIIPLFVANRTQPIGLKCLKSLIGMINKITIPNRVNKTHSIIITNVDKDVKICVSLSSENSMQTLNEKTFSRNTRAKTIFKFVIQSIVNYHRQQASMHHEQFDAHHTIATTLGILCTQKTPKNKKDK